MRSMFQFIIEPKGTKYNNKTKSGLIVNSSMEDHEYVNRIGVVKSVPISFSTNIEVGDEVIIHHNVFRRYTAMTGIEKESPSLFNDDENLFLVYPEEIFFHKRNDEWQSNDGRCLVAPVEDTDAYNNSETKQRVGMLKISNDSLEGFKISVGDIVGFTPNSEYRLHIDGQLMYCMKTNDICIKYGDNSEREEAQYNPSWAKSN
jgi:co-chaperonin GroES (HSP10)